MCWSKIHNILLDISFANIRVQQLFIRHLRSAYQQADFEIFSKVTKRHRTWHLEQCGLV